MKTVILINEEVPAGALSYKQLVEKSPEMNEIVDTADDEVAALIYTAGTTGRPKGVMHTHYSLYINAKMQYDTITVPEDLTNLSVLPLCHSYGIATVNNGLFRNAKRTILLNGFDLNALFSAIEKYKVDIMSGVPTMFVYMLLYPDLKKYDLSSLKYVFCGSAPLALENLEEI